MATTSDHTTTEEQLRAELARCRTELEHLRLALQSRVLIEQAKGVLAERYQVPIPQAFKMLHQWCRDNNVRLRDAASALTGQNTGGRS